MHPIEGLVLHEICYLDGKRARPVIYRASLAEMVVPYGSTAVNHWWKNAFDAGEGGLGKVANSLELGCDCLGEIVYLDAVQVAERRHRQHASARHLPARGGSRDRMEAHRCRNGTAEVRRSRRLVVSSIATVSNYDYGFFWYFYLDGTIAAEVKLTGIIQTQAVPAGRRVPYANPVTPDLAGPHHQHLFCFRLDMCVDGPANSVYEVDAVPVPRGPGQPVRERVHRPGHPAGNRVRRAADGGTRARAVLEDRQSLLAQRLRRAGGVQAHPAAQRAAARPGQAGGRITACAPRSPPGTCGSPRPATVNGLPGDFPKPASRRRQACPRGPPPTRPLGRHRASCLWHTVGHDACSAGRKTLPVMPVEYVGLHAEARAASSTVIPPSIWLRLAIAARDPARRPPPSRGERAPRPLRGERTPQEAFRAAGTYNSRVWPMVAAGTPTTARSAYAFPRPRRPGPGRHPDGGR